MSAQLYLCEKKITGLSFRPRGPLVLHDLYYFPFFEGGPLPRYFWDQWQATGLVHYTKQGFFSNIACIYINIF